ncbi:MAG: DUF4130 domain-containing protein [Candidatus Thermoplasmatota archaeon]|nr:DUF4130 domain-containing protein [Candidatus Thermoplasmatota archaeon]
MDSLYIGQVVELSLSKRKLELLKANENTERGDLRLAEKIDDDALQTARKDKIIRIRELIRETGREIHKMKGFVRFKLLGEKVKCGYMKPEHEVGFMVLDWFAKRFPGKVIVLGNKEQSWVSIYTEEGVSHEKSGSLESTLDELGEELDMEKKKDLTEVWERYYESQYSERRKNEELFKKNMPEKYMKRAGNKAERKFELQKLDKFKS